MCAVGACVEPPGASGPVALPPVVVPPRRLSVGTDHGCAIRGDGAVLCWGGNDYGQLGDGTFASRHTPRVVEGLRDVVEVGVGDGLSCARHRDGTVSCWGAIHRAFSSSARGWVYLRRVRPTRMEGVSGAGAMDVNGAIGCVVGARGEVRCWGTLSTATHSLVDSREAFELPELSPADRVRVQAQSACARSLGGALQCTHLLDARWSRLPVAGDYWLLPRRMCLRAADQSIVCVGEEPEGSTLRGETVTLEGGVAAMAYPELRGALDLAPDGDALCAVMRGGALRCSHAGPEAPLHRDGPRGAAVTGVRSMQSGRAFSCALQADERVTCWGSNAAGQLGVANYSAEPVDVPGLRDVVSLSEGATGHLCGVRADGSVVCWGGNEGGQLGSGHTQRVGGFVTLPDVTDAVSLTTMATGTCATLRGGRALCWGREPFALESTTPSSTARRWEGASRVIDGLVLPQGGVLTLPTTAQPAPPEHEEVSGVRTFAMSDDTLLVLQEGGRVQVWTNFVASLGGRAFSMRHAYSLGAEEVALGARHACARRADGAVLCWGMSDAGQLGLVAVDEQPPAPIEGVGRAAQITAGEAHTCALRTDGTVVCWGANTHGQLGDGSVVTPEAPVAVRGLREVAEVRAGARHTCARRTNGTVACWGDNGADALGVAGATRAIWSLGP